jgi:hypothetical protein
VIAVNKDRCLTLVFSVQISGVTWFEHPRSEIAVEPNSEYMLTTSMANIGSNGRLSLYPFAAVEGTAPTPRQEPLGLGVGIDLKTPGFFRAGYNSGTRELFVAVDLALTKESPMAKINFVRFEFDPKHKFRGALDAYYKLFPSYFSSKTPEQGVWMPFPYELSERFMQRCLAYGMFPGYFSADAATRTYFSQPELYERDRPLFKKYIPLCKRVAEAGWQPITLATSSEPKVYIERFGSSATPTYFTVFNDSQETKTATFRFEKAYTTFTELISGKTETVMNGTLSLTLLPENVAVLEPIE